jgi:hypothetical protein
MSVYRISALLARHRRLLALGLLSLLLHLLALAWIERRLALPPPSAGGTALAVRLAHVVAPKALKAPAQPEAAPAPSPEPRDDPPLLARSAPTSVARAEAPSEVVADVAPDALPGQQGVAFRSRMPARYRVTPPPSVRLRYTVTGADDAALTWRSDGNRYDLQMDGILGQRSSSGTIDDAGVAPEQSTEEFGAGSVTTRFDRAAGTVQAGLDARAQPLAQGSQDGASLLAQLAGMGLADPSQIREVLEFWVAGTNGARIERYRVLGPERIATGAGEMETVRLARIGEAGERRLEIWLAPTLSWMPVQLRTQEPDGAARTQTLAAIGPAS